MALVAMMVFPGDSGLLTRVGLIALCGLATLLTIRLVPRSWRPAGVLVPLLAVVVAFVVIRVAAESGFTEWLDHDVLERVGGETDDFPTWLLAGLSAAAVFALDRARRRR